MKCRPGDLAIFYKPMKGFTPNGNEVFLNCIGKIVTLVEFFPGTDAQWTITENFECPAIVNGIPEMLTVCGAYDACIKPIKGLSTKEQEEILNENKVPA